MTKGPIRQLLSKSLTVKPDIRTFKELTPKEQELRKALDNYYKGKGFPVELLKKLYGYGESLTIEPDPKLTKLTYL